MRLNTKKALDAAALARFTAFDKKDEETITVALPDDLTTLSDAELIKLSTDASAAFAEVYQNGEKELNADEETVLETLSAAKLALKEETARRATLSADRKAKAAALAATMVDEAPAAEAVVEAPAAVVAATESIEEKKEEKAPEAVVASAKAPLKPVTVARVKAHQAPVEIVETVASPIKAAMGLPSLTAGAAINMDQLADAFAELSESARKSPIEAAIRENSRFSAKTKVAHIERSFAPEAVVGPDNDADSAIKYVTNESNLKGGSLVAAGGWCAPSETVYDMCQLESRDGLLSVPEIQVRRGGLRFTMGPDWADIFSSTGWCFDETDDINGAYANNEVQSLTEGGAGLTSFTLTFGGQTTGSIPASTTSNFIQSALEALSTIGPNGVYVTGPAGSSTGPWNVEFVNQLGGTNVAQMTSTPTGGTGTLTVATVTAGDSTTPAAKPTDLVICPTFTDVRLNVCGLTIQSGNLLNRAYPEAVRRFVSGALTAHAHRMATNVLLSMISQSTAVTAANPTNGTGAISPVLSAIELEAEDMKYRRRMSRNQTIEAIFPFWVRGLIRADLSRRNGISPNDAFGVTDAQIDAWFRLRGINPQFIYNFDNLGAGNAVTTWPTTLRFLMYPAGTFVKGASDLITLSMIHDSTLNASNNFTALFSEEAWSVMKMCPDARIVTVPSVCPSGNAHAGSVITCP